jgi:hypothetical protein
LHNACGRQAWIAPILNPCGDFADIGISRLKDRNEFFGANRTGKIPSLFFFGREGLLNRAGSNIIFNVLN